MSRRYDYSEVNRIVREAADAGLPLGKAIAEALNVPIMTAHNILSKAREYDGTLPPSPVHRGPATPTTTRTLHPSLPAGTALEDIADRYRHAVLEGRRAVQTLADHYCVDDGKVVEWVTLAVEARLMAMPVTIVATGTEVQ